MKILATYNIKGGVGKTATAVNLAYLSVREGYRTAIWDLDPQGAASFYFRIKPKVKGGAKALLDKQRELDDVLKETDFPGLDLIPADFSYRHLDLSLGEAKKPDKQLGKLIQPLSGEYDFLFLDCAPSISLVSEAVFHAANALLVPMIPTTLSLRTYQQLLKYLKNIGPHKPDLLAFFSMVDLRKRLHKDIVDEILVQHPAVLKTTIPYASQIERMGVFRAPVDTYAAQTAPAEAYKDLWREIKERVSG
uniref:Cellulose biosynthesis protein BcsQ n=1 Tax=Candidatus Kentrum sp. FW TaxID=2126338 RepID=A0A450TD17_9GAMM|nr:MAG: Cellulose biosynthesis protein BcsQ [Candidatus Kentron sp. FW]VFJ64745.1 MAG: Cellulose biosynthesis protein BcsQ [Candidatus Kentron sp. FW]